MIPSLPLALYPVFRGVVPDEEGELCVTREQLHGVLEISRIDEHVPQDELLAESLRMFSLN